MGSIGALQAHKVMSKKGVIITNMMMTAKVIDTPKTSVSSTAASSSKGKRRLGVRKILMSPQRRLEYVMSFVNDVRICGK